MAKKPSLRVSDLYLRSMMEERAALTARAGALLRHVEQGKIPLSAAQSRHLDHALDCIAEGLFSLAICELDEFQPPRRHIDFSTQDRHGERPGMPVSTPPGSAPPGPDGDEGKPITLAALRKKLNRLNDDGRGASHGKTERVPA